MDDDIDALFKLPLDAFTPARNALAARLKNTGEQAEADAVKALPKPSVAVWVVNQLYWQHRKPFDRLIEAGDRFRQAQSREHLEARRSAQAELVRIGTAVLHEAGYSGALNMLRRVTSTLEALATYGSLPEAPRAGRLTADLTPPGFDVLAGLLPPSGGSRREAARHSAGNERAPKPVDLKRAREEEGLRVAAAAKADVREAERALRAARTQADRTAGTLEAAVKRAMESQRRRVAAEKQLAKVVTEADEARESERVAEANARKATLEAESAERLLALARRKLEEL